MRLKLYISIMLLLAGLTSGQTQTHFIGLHSDEIKRIMKEEHKDMNLDNTTINRTFNYLKYVDYLNERTLLYVLDDNDCCTWWKLMCDYSLLEEKRIELDKTYIAKGKDTWHYVFDGDIVELTLKEEEWYFSITAKLIK